MIEFALEPGHTVLPEIAARVDDDYRRSTANTESPEPINVDWSSYHQAGLNGSLMIATAREAGVLVGYIAFYLGRNLRHQHIIEATSEGLVLDEKRAGIGNQFRARAEKLLKAYGVNQVIFVFDKNAKALNRFFEQAGYQPKYICWSKSL